jgi:hypothetical protein
VPVPTRPGDLLAVTPGRRCSWIALPAPCPAAQRSDGHPVSVATAARWARSDGASAWSSPRG